MATYGGDLSLAALPRARGAGDPVRSRPRGRQRRLRAASPGRRWCGCWSASASASNGRGAAGDRVAARPASLRGGGIAAAALVALSRFARPRRDAATGERRRAGCESVQNRDGGWGASPGDDSGAEMTGWAMLGLEAAGRNPLDVATRRHDAGRLPARTRSKLEEPRRPRPHDPRPRGRRRRPARLRRPQPRRRRWRKRREQRLLRRLARLDRLRGHRPARRRRRAAASTARSPGCARSRTTTAAGATSPGSPSTADGTGAVDAGASPARRRPSAGS